MRSIWFLILFGSLLLINHSFTTASGEGVPSPTQEQCKPYVDAALKGSEATSETETESEAQSIESNEESPGENETGEATEPVENAEGGDEGSDSTPEESQEEPKPEESSVESAESGEQGGESEKSAEETEGNQESTPSEEGDNVTGEESHDEGTSESENTEESVEEAEITEPITSEKAEEVQAQPDSGESKENTPEKAQSDGSNNDNVAQPSDESQSEESKETPNEGDKSETTSENDSANKDDKEKSVEAPTESKENPGESGESGTGSAEELSESEKYEPRSRDHLVKILGLGDSKDIVDLSTLLEKVTHTTLKELKGVYEHNIKPLESLYKYRDLSNRHFGDSEIFSKPMVLFMGPWSGGKSSIINWLLGIERQDAALRVGADPSPAQFNIMIWGEEDQDLDGTQLAADWTFSGLQKFGQSFLDRLHGRRVPNRLLEKVNLVEIPGILEVRKQVERSFPFNDACQWFIDRADILFLVYDPAKLDIGPETEAILDQLKGRENQVRIVLNKADTVKPDELLRVQATLVWNISPLMSSAEPLIMYAASLWGKPLNPESPTSLLNAHEHHFLQDIRDSVDKRVETRIAAARRFAVRVRNHAKMVDCYLNTFFNHRSFFSDKKKISTDIIEHPQNYHIYEGLSTLTNISRYDLPDPDTYRDFFKLNPLWDFQTLSSTCTYFRGCPINKLDIAIAYELPELLGRFRRSRESIITAQNQPPPPPKTTGKKSKKTK